MSSYIDNYDKAKDSYAQSELQINQARNQLGDMGSAIADLYYYKAQEKYIQVNTYLDYAQVSADKGYEYTNQMKPEANTDDRRFVVDTLDQTYFDLSGQINDLRTSATTLGVQAEQGEFTSRVVTSEETINAGSLQVQDLPDDVAANIVKEQQNANAESADVQNPPLDDMVLSSDGQVVSISNASNSTNASTDQLSISSNSQLVDGEVSVPERAVNPESIQAGVCAPSDDWMGAIRSNRAGTTTSGGGGVSSNFALGGEGGGGRPVIPPGFTAPIIARPNKLSSLSSQTYSISIYITTPRENEAIQNGQKISFPPNSLIIQSGGINSSTALNQRNKYFDVDFYIDDVEIENLAGTQGTGAPHSVTTMKFRINEPNGITLLDRLDRAVREYGKIGNAPITATSQNYCMIIRFYGYDQDGKLITGEQLGLSSIFFGTDKNAISEKWIPFSIADIKYQISTKGVEYDVSAAVTQSNTMFSQTFGGTIPFNFELVAADLKTLFNGPVAYSTTQQTTTPPNATTSSTSNAATAPPKASAAGATQTVTQGLADALNRHQKDLVKKGQQEIADQYEIQLYNMPGLIDATMIKQGTQDKSVSAMNVAKSPSKKMLSSKMSYDKNTKNYKIAAGTQIVQLIDQAVRNSSYITSQQTIIFDEQTQQPKLQQPVATTMWYRVQGTAQPIGYDRKRRSTAYKFKYVITPYQINDPRSPYYSTARYRGVHKIYNYWFTGQNTEVLDFVIDVNFNYVTVVGVDTAISASYSGRWAEKRAFQTRPGESSQGGTGTSTMPAASLAERLYSQSDVAKAEVTIVGDPDWIVQSEVFFLNPTFDSFMPDGSVNAAGSEVLFEMRFNTPTDFDLQTGLTPTFQNNSPFSVATGDRNLPSQSIVYSANIIKSYFKGGKFTQKLIGTIKSFDKGIGSVVLTNNALQTSQSRTTAQTGTAATLAAAGIEPFNTAEYNKVASSIDDAGGVETTTQQQQQILDYAAYNAVADTIDDAGGIAAINAQTGTDTVLVEGPNPIQEDADNTSVSPSLPTSTTNAAPDDDAGYDP